MSLEELTQRQQDTGSEIKRIATNFKKDGESRKTIEYVQRRLRTIDQLWSDFEETDTQIRTLYGNQFEHSYFVKSYYEGIQTGYDQFRQELLSRLQSAKSNDPPLITDISEDPLVDTAADKLKLGIEYTRPKSPQDGSSTRGARPKENHATSETRPSQLASLVCKQKSLMKVVQHSILNRRIPNNRQSLQMTISTIQRHFQEVQNLHYKIWDQTDVPDTVDYEIETYFNLEEAVQNKLAQLYDQMDQLPQNASSNAQPTSGSSSVMVKLPKICLPTFDGDYLKWRQFRDLFVELVHNQPIARCQKLWYLKTSLSGEAEKLIRHLTTSETSYETAWQLLTDRYENTRLLVTALLNKLLSQPTISSETAAAIKNMHDSTQECLLALQNLGVPTDQWDPLVLHILVKKLDRTTHTLWEQSLAQPRMLQPLKSFQDFLHTRFQSLEALGNRSRSTEERRLQTFRSLASTTNTGLSCPACKGGHKIFACQRFLRLPPSKRINLVKGANLCFNCLRPGHNLDACTAGNCTKCSRKHNSLLHLPGPSQRQDGKNTKSQGQNDTSTKESSSGGPPPTDTAISLATETAISTRKHILLSTVVIKLSTNNGPATECRAILDSGSQINLITERMVKRMGLVETPDTMCIEGIGQRKQQTQRRVNVKLQSRINGYHTRLEAYILPRIVSPQPTQMIDITSWPIPDNIQLADPDFNKPNSIDLLIGAELFYTILSVGQIKLGDTLPILQNTVFGWTASGIVHKIPQTKVTCAIFDEQQLDQHLEKFWKLEETTTTTNNFTAAEKRCETYFNQTTKRGVDGRFIVRLPFQNDPMSLGESKDIALQRFLALERSLAKKPELKEQYAEFIKEYINLGHMKEVDFDKIEQPYCFLPHHCVIKPHSSTTKLRVVFDASAKTSSNIALNNILHTGPTIQDDVFSILLRFRMPRFTFTADIEKMYRQIQVDAADQKYQLIWWRNNSNEKVKCFQLSTVTYGTTCAPYLATKCLQRLSEEEAANYSLGAEVLARDFYVDDVLTGSDSLILATEMQSQLKMILQSAGFKLRKWCGNHPRLLENIPENDRELQLDLSTKSEDDIKTIGLTWLPKTDEFFLKTSWSGNSKVTKRTALSDIAHLFDPLGIMAPVVVVAKIFLQRLWTLKLNWDAALPQELHSSWVNYREGLKTLSSIKFPRHVLAHRVAKSMQLHIFADASEKAFGAAAYIRAIDKDNIVIVRLLCAKSKVAPIKQTTLPRLELCAAKMAVELAERIKRDLSLRNEATYLWTDSEIVLSWINSPSSSFHTFVANRVSIIQQLSVPQQWRHVGSRDNPADVLSRGIAPEKMRECTIWFYGPTFLHGRESIWPTPYSKSMPENNSETKQISAAATTVDASAHFIDLVEHRNSFSRLKRITAYILRFLSRVRVQDRPPTSNLTLNTQELNEAETAIIRLMQEQEFKEDIRLLKLSGEVAKTSPLSSLTPFVDDRGLIRVGGRLEESNLPYDAKHPILLPYSHQFTKLLINDTHREHCHAGPQALLAILRQKFWPIKGKTLTRSVVQRCVQCTKAKPQFLSQLMGNLPADRVQPARPFVNVGIDFCGPIYTHFKIRGKRPQKSYIAVFCCFATKAVHLEVVSDLSSEGFLGSLKRFIGRRGRPKNIYCDNATNFVGAKNQLQELKDIITSDATKQTITAACSSKGIDFQFIPPRAPHFGGLWEAAVKSAKHLMQRTFASAALTYEELETAIIEIESVLNSRPLTPMSADPNDLMALTPGHFLIGEPLTSSIDTGARPQTANMITRWKLVVHIKNEFWRRWSNEYLSHLQHRNKWKQRCQNIEPGSMVIIKEDNCPSLKWPLGRIVNVIKGKDGLVRVADVRTSSGILRRVIHKLAPLPLEDNITKKDFLAPKDIRRKTQQPDVPENATTSLENREDSSKNAVSHPRKKQRRALGSALVTLLLTCLMLPTSNCSLVTVTPFKSHPGIYLENLGATNIVSDEWHIVAYYDMKPYWEELSSFVNCTKQLKRLCNTMTKREPCSLIVNQFEHLREELSRNNDLLSPPANQTRTKRGAINFIGNIANSLFGVLDSQYAEEMSKTIDNIGKNENFLLNLIKNQTSLIDATANVMKKEKEATANQFRDLESQVNEITKHITDVREELFQEKSSQLFISLSIQTMLIASNLHRIQDAIIDVIVDTHHGRISPQLMSPAQLQKELINIKGSLPASLRLAAAQEDVLKYYNLMTIQGRAAEKHIIFRISLPLLTLEDFELFKITPVPVLVNDTFLAIRPSFPFLVINLHRDLYYPLTEQDIASCISIAEDKHLCKQKRPIYHRGAEISACEVNFINHLPHTNSCQIMKTGDGPYWIQLHNPNHWIYSLRDKTTINIVCGDNVTRAIIEGAGILQIQSNCMVKQALITIRGHNIMPSSTRLSYVPSSNLTDFMSVERLAPVFHHTHHYQPDLAELESIKKQLSQLPTDLPERLHTNDAHHFAIGYIGLLSIAITIGYLSWKHCITQKSSPSKNFKKGDKNEEDVSSTLEENGSFNTNFAV